MGAGKSFDSGLKRSIELDASYIIKIDGDNQFKKDDVLKIKSILEKNILTTLSVIGFGVEEYWGKYLLLGILEMHCVIFN